MISNGKIKIQTIWYESQPRKKGRQTQFPDSIEWWLTTEPSLMSVSNRDRVRLTIDG